MIKRWMHLKNLMNISCIVIIMTAETPRLLFAAAMLENGTRMNIHFRGNFLRCSVKMQPSSPCISIRGILKLQNNKYMKVNQSHEKDWKFYRHFHRSFRKLFFGFNIWNDGYTNSHAAICRCKQPRRIFVENNLHICVYYGCMYTSFENNRNHAKNKVSDIYERKEMELQGINKLYTEKQ